MTTRFPALRAACTILHVGRRAQPAPASFTLDQVLSFPFADNLVTSPSGVRFASTVNEPGAQSASSPMR